MNSQCSNRNSPYITKILRSAYLIFNDKDCLLTSLPMDTPSSTQVDSEKPENVSSSASVFLGFQNCLFNFYIMWGMCGMHLVENIIIILQLGKKTTAMSKLWVV